MVNTNVTPFPAFSEEDYQSHQMRQLVSALEHRFQGLEAETATTTSAGDDLLLTDLDVRFSPFNHTHGESDIVNLQDYLLNIQSESIFELTDVSGTPDDKELLQWNESFGRFDTVSIVELGVVLDNLADLSLPNVQDNDILYRNPATDLWEATNIDTLLVSSQSNTGDQFKIKGADQSKASDTTISTDDELNGWVIPDNSRFFIEGYLKCTQNVGNFQCSFNDNFTSLESGVSYRSVDETAVAAQDHVQSLADGFTLVSMTDTNEFSVSIAGIFRVDTGGVLNFGWAQQTSSANNTTVFAGSWINVRQL